MSLDGPIAVVQGINDLKEASVPNTNTLFYLNNENLPYRSSSKLMNVKMNFLGGDFSPYDSSTSTTDFFQYIVLLRNAKAITPFKN